VTAVGHVVDRVAIPGVLLKFLERASIGYAATRDRSLVPHFHWVCGWTVEPDPSTLSFHVSSPFPERLLQDVAECPRIALTIEAIGPHETYQFKGEFAATREPGPGDLASFERGRERFVTDVLAIEQRFDFAPDTLERYLGAPALVVTMAVQEIFLQTPGPGAGRRMVPAESR
jgi:hypothetical protein